MSKNYAMKADARDGAGKGVARALRRDHKVPAVIYGDNQSPITITLPMKEINVEYNRGHMFTTLCDLEVDGKKHLVLARDIQLHPVRDDVLHVDFLRVTAKTAIKVDVPVNIIGFEDSPGAKEKGILNTTRHSVELICSATKIPDAVDVNAAEVNIGDSIKSTDAALPEGSTFAIDDREFTIATVTAPRVMTEEEEETEGEDGEEVAAGDVPADNGGDKPEGEEKSE